MATRTKKKAARATLATTKGNNNPATAAPGSKVKGGGAGMSSAGKGKKKPKKKGKGDPVSVATGAVVESVNDLVLPGAFPLFFVRSYSSTDAGTSTPFGRSGWTHSLHQWIEADAGEFVHFGERLAETRYPKLGRDEGAFDRGTRTTLVHKMDGIFELTSLEDRLTREFAPLLPGGHSMLRAIRDAWGNRIELHYELGRLATIVDTARREVRVGHDARGRVTSLEVWVAGAVHKTLRYQYTEEGDLAAAIDARGNASRYAYDGKHRLVRKTLPTGFSFHYEYDPESGRCRASRGDGNLHKVELTYDTAKKTTTTHGEREPRVFAWDDRGHVLRESSFDEAYVEAYEYDDDGHCTAQENAAGHRVEITYDARGNVVKSVDPAGNASTFEYDRDCCVKHVSGNGNARTFSYDDKGAIVGVRFENGQTFGLDYDGAGHLVALYGNGATLVRREWDAQHNLVRVVDARAAEWRYAYDALGRAIERRSPMGAITRIDYDAAGNVVAVHHHDGTHDQYTYDALGNVVRIVQRDGLSLQRKFVLRRMVEQIDADGSVWRFEYDRLERLIAVVNPKAERHEFRYDRRGQIVEESTFDGRILKYSWSKAARLSRIEYPDGTWRQFTYDPRGALVQEDTSDGSATFERDQLSRLLGTTIEDGPLAFTVKYELDALGRVLAETQGDQTIRYTYNPQGRTATRTLPNGQRTEYVYDVFSAMVGIDHEGERLRVERDVTGKEIRRTLFDGALEMVTAWDLDQQMVGRAMSALAPGGGVPALLSQRNWQYTPSGRLVAERDAFEGTTGFEHDPVRQLVAVTGNAVAERFRYNPAGAITEALGNLTRAAGAWDVAQGNVLLRTPAHEYAYDENHRRTKKVERATGATTTYEWDCRQRLRRVRLPDGTVATYFYDALGRRVRKEILKPGNDQPRVVRFLWDGMFIIAEQDSVRGERVFVHDPFTFDLMLQSEKGKSYAYVLDPAGRPRELVDRQGRVAWRATYSAWGRVVSTKSDPAYAGPDVDSPFRLLGHYWDEESGLASAMYRYFDPDTGRWLSADPTGIGGGVSLFGFDGSPATDADPLGLDFEGTRYNPDGSLTPEYYAYLRARTPTDDLRTQVNTPPNCQQDADGNPIDPITGQPVSRLEADHIVPMKQITEMPGFNQLTTEEQLSLLNAEENFWGLGRSTNGSKSDQDHSEWRTFKGEDLDEEQIALLEQKDKVARAAIARKLKAMLAKKKKC